MAVDRHRYDDPDPYLYRTEDYGRTWVSLSDKLPPGGHIQVVRTDGRNRDLLFVGTEFGLFVSLDGGATWTQLRKGLPPVAVHDLAIQPRDRELVIATHGRGLFVMDAAPLEQWTPKAAAEPLHLFDVKPATEFLYRNGRELDPDAHYVAPNPPFGATIYYQLKEKARRPRPDSDRRRPERRRGGADGRRRRGPSRRAVGVATTEAGPDAGLVPPGNTSCG